MFDAERPNIAIEENTEVDAGRRTADIALRRYLRGGIKQELVEPSLRTLLEIILATPRVFLRGCCKTRLAGNSVMQHRSGRSGAAECRECLTGVLSPGLQLGRVSCAAALAFGKLDPNAIHRDTRRSLSAVMMHRIISKDTASGCMSGRVGR